MSPRKAMRTGGWQGRREAIVLCTWPTEDAARRRCSPPRRGSDRISGGLRLVFDNDSVLVYRNGRRNRYGAACIRHSADGLVDLHLELLGDLGGLAQEALRVVSPLPEPRLAVGEERPGLRDQVVLEREVE